MLARTLAASLAFASPVLAQTQWVVDTDGDGDFQTLQAAADQALPGDQIWVTPGVYGDVALPGGVVLRGTLASDPPGIASVVVLGVEGVTLRDLEIESASLGAGSNQVLIEDCELEQLTIEGSQGVFVQRVRVTGQARVQGESAVVLRDSLVEACGSCLVACDGEPALRVSDAARVWVDGCSLIGGDAFGGGSLAPFEGPGLHVEGSAQVVVSGGPHDQIAVGDCSPADPSPWYAIRAEDQSSVRVAGPRIVGRLWITGDATLTCAPPDQPVLSVLPALDLLGPWSVELSGPAGAPAWLLASAPAGPVPLVGIEGLLWGQLDEAALLASVVLDGAEAPVSLAFPNPAALGAQPAVVLQMLALVPQPLAFEPFRGDLYPWPPATASVGIGGAGDFDGDGREDLLVAVGLPEFPMLEELRWFRNPGLPGEAWESQSIAGGIGALTGEVNRFVASDMDGDGDLDVVGLYQAELFILNDSVRIGWWENLDGLGTFGNPTAIDQIYPGLNQLGDLFLVEDFDGDGDPDLLMERGTADGPATNAYAYYENLGGGAFAKGIDLSVGPYLRSADAADIDGDGDADLLLGDEGQESGSSLLTVWILENLGANQYANPTVLYHAAAEGAFDGVGRDVQFADLDQDGVLDVLAQLTSTVNPLQLPAAEEQARIVWFRGLGPGQGYEELRTLVEGIASDRLTLADLDGDGDLDITAVQAEFGRVRQLIQGESLEDWSVRELALPVGDLDPLGAVALSSAPASIPEVFVGGATVQRIRSGPFAPVPKLASAHLLAFETTLDCNGDGIADAVQIELDADLDLDGNGLLDACQADCDNDGVADGVELALGLDFDCNGNGVPDQCDLLTGTSVDVDGNGVPDECEPDCDGDGVFDALELLLGTAVDVDGNGIPDDCEADCDGDGLPDPFEIASGRELDCNRNGIPDSCDIASGTSADVGSDGIPDECQPDCDGDGVPDSIELLQGTQFDCDQDGVADDCAIASGLVADCNGNGIPDACDLSAGTSQDVNANGVPDECEPDCDGDGLPDAWEIQIGTQTDADLDGQPDECTLASFDFEAGASGWDLQGLWQLNPDQACGSVTQSLGFNRWPLACDFDVTDPSGTATSPAFPVPASGNLEVQFDGRLDGGTDFILITQAFLVSDATGETLGLFALDPPVVNDGQLRTHVGQLTGLQGLAGQQVRLQFSFSAFVGPHQGPGWQIDNLRIDAF